MKWVEDQRGPDEVRSRLVAMEIAYDLRSDTHIDQSGSELAAKDKKLAAASSTRAAEQEGLKASVSSPVPSSLAEMARRQAHDTWRCSGCMLRWGWVGAECRACE